MSIERDYNILKALSAGAATKSYIYRTFFKKEDGNWVTRQGFEKVMKRLIDAGYLIYNCDKNLKQRKHVNIYVLAPKGVNEVCNEFCIERDFIRHTLPRKEEFKHELIVADVIRIINKESVDKKSYLIDYIYDDKIMKKKVPPKKGLYYPDLRISIIPKIKSRINFNIEVDAGTKPQGYWIKKMRSWQDTTLILTLNENRLKQLYGYAAHSTPKAKHAFAVHADFSKGGLLWTQWMWTPEKTMARLDL